MGSSSEAAVGLTRDPGGVQTLGARIPGADLLSEGHLQEGHLHEDPHCAGAHQAGRGLHPGGGPQSRLQSGHQ